MERFNKLCQQVADGAPNNYTYNWGWTYISITFSTYGKMWAFKKSKLYKELKPYRVLSRYKLHPFYSI